MGTTRRICAGLVLLVAFAGQAAPLKFAVRNDHADLLYGVGEEAVFTVSVTGTNGLGVAEGLVEATLDNFGTKNQLTRSFDLAKSNVFELRGRLDEPGFLRLTLRAKDTPNFVWSVGYDPQGIRKGSPSPDDFDAFWAEARNRLAKEVPLDARMAKVPERSTADFDFYRISFATFGRRVHGYMSVPTDRTKAPYPVEVQVAAAGFGNWTNDMEGNRDVIRVFFSVYPWAPHWQWRELDLKSAYDLLNECSKLKFGCSSYPVAGLAVSREDYFFYPVLLGIDRAIDWVAAHPDVDRSRFWYQGGSQGGGLGIFLTGLNRVFTRAAFFVPALTDTMGYLKGRKSGWPSMTEAYADSPALKAVAAKNAPYFDAANFASRITCPVRVAVGFADSTCPPCAVYAAYNEIPVADKDIQHGFGMTHGCFPGFNKEILEWLRRR